MQAASLRKQYNETLLGRLRLELFKKISASSRIPSAKEQRHFLLVQYRANAAVGKVYKAILFLPRTHCLRSSQAMVPEDVADLLARLERDPLDLDSFVEFQNEKASPASFGVLVTRCALEPTGFNYEVTLFDSDNLVERVSRMEIRGGLDLRCAPFAVQSTGGFEHYGIEDLSGNEGLDLALKALRYLAEHQGIRPVRVRDLQFLPNLCPPRDQTCQRLIAGIYRGTIKCSAANVPLRMISPFSKEFCLEFPNDIIRSFSKLIRTRAERERRLLVYWNGLSFVMSDDYGMYLAYRHLDCAEVPVVIVGNVPESIRPIEFGGPELFPPLHGFSLRTQGHELNDDEVDRLIDGRAKESEPNSTISHLYALHFILAEIVNRPNVSESDLHEFLANNPVLLDPTGFGVRSEVCLGSEYRVDLILQFRDVERQVLLVELERASIELFTRKGRPRAEVTHAIQQVEDWLRWWRENPDLIPEGLDPSIVPKGVVVIGRTKQLDQEMRRRLTHLNSNRDVVVLTYDDLLIRVEDLVHQLETFDSNDRYHRPNAVEEFERPRSRPSNAVTQSKEVATADRSSP